MKKLIQLLFIPTLYLSCTSQDHKIKLINESGIMLDSVSINIVSAERYTIALKAINFNDSLTAVIPKGLPASNKHDITIGVTVFIKGQKPIYQYLYNDLTGSLLKNYRVRLNEKMELIWNDY